MELAVVFLQAIELELLRSQSLLGILVLVQQFFLMGHSFITLVQIALSCGLRLLQLVFDLFYLTGPLRFKVRVVSLQSIHFSLQSGLFFTLDHASLLVFDLSATIRGL